MKVTIKINLDNQVAYHSPGEELARRLRLIADASVNPADLTKIYTGTVLDGDGKIIGKISVD